MSNTPLSRYCFGTTPVGDFAALCRRFTGDSLQSPYRSTVPLLSLLEHAPDRWNNLLEALGAPFGGTMHLEYGVASPKPGGNASQTDVLITSEAAVWAIEAKWTEGRYPTVEKRISKPESDGGDPRITVAGWLRMLQPYANRPLSVETSLTIIYQILHRAASACAVAAEKKLRPELVYLHFHPSPDPASASTDDYIADLRRLHEVLGAPDQFPFWVVEMPLHATPAFDTIKDLDKRSAATTQHVVAALHSGPLFTFGDPKVTRIDRAA